MFSVKDKGFELALTGQKLEKIELHFLLPRKIVIVFLPLSGIVKTNPQNLKSKHIVFSHRNPKTAKREPKW